jgi:hypothetical protein
MRQDAWKELNDKKILIIAQISPFGRNDKYNKIKRRKSGAHYKNKEELRAPLFLLIAPGSCHFDRREKSFPDT